MGLATGAQPETMLGGPIPPGWRADGIAREERNTWITKVLTAYGDVTPSMLQDIRRARRTEIEFINGYVVNMARQFGLDAPINAAIVETVHRLRDRNNVLPERVGDSGLIHHVGILAREVY